MSLAATLRGKLAGAGAGAVWTVLGYGGAQGLRLASNLVMTRLLAPEAFGLIGMALTINYALIMLTDVGINASVVRSDRGDDPAFLRTAWVTTAARNAILYALLLLIAGGIALFSGALPADTIYTNPALPAFVAVGGLQVLIQGFASPNLALAERRIQLRRVVMLELGSQVASITVMIVCALSGLGAWSLLAGLVTGVTLQATLSHVLLDGPRMAFAWDRDHFAEIFGFGKWLLLASLFGFALNRGDQLVFGALFEERVFSLYVIASLWVLAAAGVGSAVLTRVAYPALSEAVRRNDDSLKRLYDRYRLLADGLAVVLFLALCLGIGPFFELFYREAYEEAAVMVRLLSVSILLMPYRLINTVILAGGDSRRFAAIVAPPALAVVVVLPLAERLGGLEVAVLSFGLIQLVTVPMAWWMSRRWLRLSMRAEMRMIVAVALAATTLLLT